MNRLKMWLLKFSEKIFKKIVSNNNTMTIKGRYFREYCKNIRDESDFGKIEEYEKILENVRQCLVSSDGSDVTREEAARYFYELTSEMEDA